MKTIAKIREFLDEYGVHVFFLVVALVIAGLIVYAITAPNLTEGLVMNKRFSPGYLHCYDGKCHASSDRWIIEVQNGDQKDMWIGSEGFYDEVKLGEWITK